MPIPWPDPQGIPAPVWLLQGLAVLTIVLHVVPMSVTLGGSALGLVAAILGRRDDARGRQGDKSALTLLARQLTGMMPAITAFTITLGVAPLLFVQVLYGVFFYPATILMGWYWLSVVGLLILGYGGLYLLAWREPELGAWHPWVRLATLAAFLAVAVIFSNAYTLMTRPQVWLETYAATAGLGTALNLADPTLVPRLTHVLLGVVAVAASLVVLLGHLTTDETNGRAVRRYGLFWLVSAVLLQLAAGPWYLTRLTPAARAALNDWGGSVVIPAAAVLGLAAVAVALLAERHRRAPGLAVASAGLLVLTVALLAVLRQVARQGELAPLLPDGLWRVQPQTVVFVLFFLILIASLGVLAWLVLRFRREAAAGAGTVPGRKSA